MDMLEQISGNRVNYAINTIGGVRRDMTPEIKERAYKGLDAMEERLKYYTDVVLKEKSIAARVAGVGAITKEQAIELSAVGPNARCCGVPIDVRKDDPYAAYADIPFNVITHDSCDTLGQVIVRVLETFESFKMCRYMLDNMPSGEIRAKAKRKVPPGETVIRVEAPRGEDIHYLRSNGTDKPERWKVRAPTLGNIPSVAERLKGGYVADIPIVLAGIDPCFSCTDRITFVDKNTKRTINTTLTDLRLNPKLF
jgi:NADH-quinone oxidoreductase subunit D